MGNQVSKCNICDACQKKNCDNCESRLTCDCPCNVGRAADVIQKALTTAVGIGTAAGGLALTLVTGGLAIPVGGAMMGAGISAAYQGIEKSVKKERIDAKGLAVDAAFGAVTGVLTGGVGAVGEAVAANVVKAGATEAVKQLAVRAGTGAVSGVAAKAIDEIKTCATTDKEWKNFGKTMDGEGNCSGLGTIATWTASMAVGALGGAATQISSSASGAVSSGVGKAAVRVAVSGATACAADAAGQGINIAAGNQEEFDVKQTVLAGTVSGITTAGMEATKSAVYASYGGKEQFLEKQTDRKLIEKSVPGEERDKVLKAYDDLNKVPKGELEQELSKAAKYSKWKDVNNNLQNKKTTVGQNYDHKIQRQINLERAAIARKDYKMANVHQKKVQNFIAKRNVQVSNINRAMKNPPLVVKADLKPMGGSNAHALAYKFAQVVVDNVIKNPNPGDIFNTVMMQECDGMAGYSAGQTYNNLAQPTKSSIGAATNTNIEKGKQMEAAARHDLETRLNYGLEAPKGMNLDIQPPEPTHVKPTAASANSVPERMTDGQYLHELDPPPVAKADLKPMGGSNAHALVENKFGQVAVDNVIKNSNPGDLFDTAMMPECDGKAGYSAGQTYNKQPTHVKPTVATNNNVLIVGDPTKQHSSSTSAQAIMSKIVKKAKVNEGRDSDDDEDDCICCSRKLKVMYFNARSINPENEQKKFLDKLSEIQQLIKSEKPDVIAIVETWLQPNHSMSQVVNALKLDDKYKVLRQDRKTVTVDLNNNYDNSSYQDANPNSNRNGGGILVAFKKSLQTSSPPIFIIQENSEDYWDSLMNIEIKQYIGCQNCRENNRSWYLRFGLTVVYVRPGRFQNGETAEQYNKYRDTLIDRLAHISEHFDSVKYDDGVRCSKHAIVGDFNLEVDQIRDKMIFNMLTKQTRATHRAGRAIDHVFYWPPDYVENLKVTPKLISDHKGLIFKLCLGKDENSRVCTAKRCKK